MLITVNGGMVYSLITVGYAPLKAVLCPKWTFDLYSEIYYQSLNESVCAVIKSCKQTDFCLPIVMTATSTANA